MIPERERPRPAEVSALKLAEAVVSLPEPERVERARWKLRHVLLLVSFLAIVVVPTALGTLYLFTRAADQYHSAAAFSVRSEEFASPLAALSAFTQTGASSASDSTVLYDFIRSQPIVEALNGELDFRTLFNRAPEDVVFALGPDPTTEELVDYWERMVSVAVDPASGVIEVEVRAFRPEDAQAVLKAILAASSRLVDDLSRIAREDAMKYAIEDLAEAEAGLREMRRKIGEFRVANQIIDPSADVMSQMGVISALQGRLAEALVERETVGGYARAGDQRLADIDRRIQAIERQIEEERAAVSQVTGGKRALSEVIGEYEALLVDLQFSQDAYTAARAAEEQARAEARRQTRYLAVHIPPTVAEESLYPRRFLLAGLLFACAFAAWAVMALIYYNVRDRS